MTTQSIILPYTRASLHIPRRDLVLSLADSLALEISIIQYDNPNAPALELSGGMGGPSLTVAIWPEWCIPGPWDYGRGTLPSTPLWTGGGVISDTKPGTFNVTFPPATMASWVPRCGWSAQLDWDNTQSAQLCCGYMNIMPGFRTAPAPDDEPITTDALDPITTD